MANKTFHIGKVLSDNTSKTNCTVMFNANLGVNADANLNFVTNFSSNKVAVNAATPSNKTNVSKTIKNVDYKSISLTIRGDGTYAYVSPFPGTKPKAKEWGIYWEITLSEPYTGILNFQFNAAGRLKNTFNIYESDTPFWIGKLDTSTKATNTTDMNKTDFSVIGIYDPTNLNTNKDFEFNVYCQNKSTLYFAAATGVIKDLVVSLNHNAETFTSNKSIVYVGESLGKNIYVHDPVAQTFYINPKEYPNGLFLSKADVYFSQKPDTGSSSTAWIYITKTVNGYPSSDSYITNSRVEKPYASVNLPTGTSIAPIPAATTFTFSDPIHLEAGEYAIVVGSDDAKYRVFVSELGSTDLATGKLISTNPDGNVGSFFMSQNARTWTADQTKDMMFNIHKCVFNTASLDVEIPLIKDSDSIISDMISITSPDKEIAGTSLKYYSKLGGDYITVNNNTNTKLAARTTLSSATTPYVKYTLASTDTNLSPVIQKDKINMKFFQNAINTKLDLLVDEIDPYKGNAAAKYVTKKVVLADGFDATGIRVLLDVNRLHGTSIEVFVKAVAGDDFSKFEDHYYKQITLKGDTQYSSTDNDFVIDEYKIDNFSYQFGNITYSSFKTFIVKVVMYSDNPVNFPRVKNLRAIATS
jgi:hypothetical protein